MYRNGIIIKVRIMLTMGGDLYGTNGKRECTE